jgi:hypothetical protein
MTISLDSTDSDTLSGIFGTQMPMQAGAPGFGVGAFNDEEWSALATTPGSRCRSHYGSRRLYVIGGQTNRFEHNNVYVYDPEIYPGEGLLPPLFME